MTRTWIHGALLLALAPGACGDEHGDGQSDDATDPTDPTDPTADEAGESDDAASPTGCLDDGSGYLELGLSGALVVDIDVGNEVDCGGAPVPDAVVVKFEVPAGPGGERVLVHVFSEALDREFVGPTTGSVWVGHEGVTWTARPCALELSANVPIGPDDARFHAVEGTATCDAPLVDGFDGQPAVTLEHLAFRGRVLVPSG